MLRSLENENINSSFCFKNLSNFINKVMEEKFLINGGTKLVGEIKTDGAKNAFLPILAGCVLAEDEFCLNNYVNLSDLLCMREILAVLYCKTSSDDGSVFVDTRNIKNAKISFELTQKVRASIFLLGPLLSKFRSAVMAFPGGCNIGSRPIDIHINGLKSFGARIVERHGYIYCYGENMHSAQIRLSFPSVGATESLMMCATLLDGESVLKNCAKEPEIIDLQNFLNKMGAKVSGAGTDTIKIVGVKHLHGCEYDVMGDRIVAGTYLLAAATCGGDVTVFGTKSLHNESLISFLKQTACQIDTFDDKIRLKADKRLSSILNIQTMPYPNFPTDLQSQMMVLQTVSDGVSVIGENVFENRFAVACELNKMGADIAINGKTALVRGVEKLYGADVFSTDLRAGAALVIAGMKAEGYTTVHNGQIIDRGYEKIEDKYKLLGADITRIVE